MICQRDAFLAAESTIDVTPQLVKRLDVALFDGSSYQNLKQHVDPELLS